MRSQLKSWLRRVVSAPHPPAEKLVEWIDHELEPTKVSEISMHLSRCTACRNRVDELREGLRFFSHSVQASTPAFSVEEGLARLTSAIGSPVQQKSESPQATTPASAVYARLLSELSIYLGQRTAVKVLSHCNGDILKRDRLAAEVEPVVTTFLGPHTGSAVMTNVLRIWDRTNQVAG